MKFYAEYADCARISDHSLGALKRQIDQENRRAEILAQCGLQTTRPHVAPSQIESYIEQARKTNV